MTSISPRTVSLTEVGPRDGFQSESRILVTEHKRDIILGLVEAGFKEIQVTAFVHPKWVPQMADAEALVASLPRKEGVVYNALVLNPRGMDRAIATGMTSVEVSVSPSEAQSRRNANMSAEAAVAQGVSMIRRGKEKGMEVRAGIQCAFGCTHEGEVPESGILGVVERFLDADADRISIADTTGMATPPSIGSLVSKLTDLMEPDRLVLHLHDTRGLGLVNVMSALEHGVRRFDVSLGGLGGCPFLKGASGNIATEDTIHLMDSLGIATGVDKAAVARLSADLEPFFSRSFPARMLRVLQPIRDIEEMESASPRFDA